VYRGILRFPAGAAWPHGEGGWEGILRERTFQSGKDFVSISSSFSSGLSPQESGKQLRGGNAGRLQLSEFGGIGILKSVCLLNNLCFHDFGVAYYESGREERVRTLEKTALGWYELNALDIATKRTKTGKVQYKTNEIRR
jgi:hypothetical protein